MGRPSAELLSAVNELAAEKGWSPEDILTIFSYETGGTMDPWQKGPTTKWGEHRGLIQWGEPQRKKYGVSSDTPVREQVQAAGRYWEDRGAKPGMGILPLYAAVNAGNVNNIDASDEAAGGAPGTVLDKVNNQMEGHRKNAYMWTDSNYVPRENSGVVQAGRASDSYHKEVLGQTGPEVPELTTGEQFVADIKDIPGSVAKGAMKDGVKALFGIDQAQAAAPVPPMHRVSAPPPMAQAPQTKIVLRKEKKKR